MVRTILTNELTARSRQFRPRVRGSDGSGKPTVITSAIVDRGGSVRRHRADDDPAGGVAYIVVSVETDDHEN